MTVNPFSHIKKVGQRFSPTIILITLVLLHTMGFLWFNAVDYAPIFQDTGEQYRTIFFAAENVKQSGFFKNAELLWRRTHLDNGPTFHFPAVLLSLVFGSSYDVISAVNLLFLGFLVWGVYALGSKMYSSSIGTLAAVFVTFYPAVFYSSRLILADFALTTMVTLSALWLLRSEGFSLLKESLFLGLVLGLTTITKFAFSLFLIVPFIVEFLPRISSDIRKREYDRMRGRILNILLCMGVVVLISFSWYIINAPEFLKITSPQFNAWGRTDLGLFHILTTTITYHLPYTDWLLLFRGLFGDLLLAIFVLSLVVLLFKGKKKIFLMGWIIIPLLVFSTFYPPRVLLNQDSLRRLAPIFPAISIIMAYGLLTSVGWIRNRIDRFGASWSMIWTLITIALVILLHINMFLAVSTNGRLGSVAFIGPLDMIYGIGGDTVPTIPRDTAKMSPNPIALRVGRVTTYIQNLARLDENSLNILFINPRGRFDLLISQFFRNARLESRYGVTYHECLFNSIDFAKIDARRSIQSLENCSSKLVSADVVVIGPAAEEDYPPTVPLENLTRKYLESFFAESEEYEILYAAKSVVSRGKIKDGLADYLLVEDGAWGQREWQVPVTIESLDEFSGFVYVRQD